MDLAGAKPYLLVAAGGAAGSVLRYAAAVVFGAGPLTTFGVNITGSFLIGLLAAGVSDPASRTLLGTGVLGGFTTFSAWQLEAVLAARSRANSFESIWILFGSLVAGFAACWIGIVAGQRNE